MRAGCVHVTGGSAVLLTSLTQCSPGCGCTVVPGSPHILRHSWRPHRGMRPHGSERHRASSPAASLQAQQHPRLVMRRSSMHGFGLFAAEDIGGGAPSKPPSYGAPPSPTRFCTTRHGTAQHGIASHLAVCTVLPRHTAALRCDVTTCRQMCGWWVRHNAATWHCWACSAIAGW